MASNLTTVSACASLGRRGSILVGGHAALATTYRYMLWVRWLQIKDAPVNSAFHPTSCSSSCYCLGEWHLGAALLAKPQKIENQCLGLCSSSEGAPLATNSLGLKLPVEVAHLGGVESSKLQAWWLGSNSSGFVNRIQVF